VSDDQQQTPPATEADTVPITDINQFVMLTARWHARAVAQARHFLQLPEGTEMEIGGEPLTLEGDLFKGMKLGVEFALMSLGELPFAAEIDEAANDDAAPAGG
jgi:hypothetical protein